MTTEANSGDSPVDTDAAVVANQPEFASLQESESPHAVSSIDRFKDVRIDLWAELGRIRMPVGELLTLGEGSVIRLDRAVGESVNLVSQGVLVARGEIVVVDDHFAIRIKEIEPVRQP